MRYTKDMTGRFAMRPHYEPAELDKECEKILSTFFGGGIPTPIDTDSLARLIERDTSDFDPGADLGLWSRRRRRDRVLAQPQTESADRRRACL